MAGSIGLNGGGTAAALPPVAFYDTRPGHEVGLFYNTPEPRHSQGQWHTY